MNWDKIGKWFIEMFAMLEPGAPWGFYTPDIHMPPSDKVKGGKLRKVEHHAEGCVVATVAVGSIPTPSTPLETEQ